MSKNFDTYCFTGSHWTQHRRVRRECTAIHPVLMAPQYFHHVSWTKRNTGVNPRVHFQRVAFQKWQNHRIASFYNGSDLSVTGVGHYTSCLSLSSSTGTQSCPFVYVVLQQQTELQQRWHGPQAQDIYHLALEEEVSWPFIYEDRILLV